MANTITVAAPPNTNDIVSQVLATMAALSGVITDYNDGSQIKTQVESLGAVIEQQGAWTTAAVFQAVVYSALAIFNIVPNQATQASGVVMFMTASPPITGVAASQNVSIPSGSIVSTAGGFQFTTTQGALLPAGSSGVSVPVLAVTGGTTGNVPASGISQIITTLSYPLFVSNPAPTSGGLAAETSSQAMARFAAARSAIGLSSPGAIANAVIGVMASGTSETVLYSTCYEPWVAAGSGAGSGVAGYSVYIDNGTGTASSGLIAAATSQLNGGLVSGATNAGALQGVGFRDAGVPYSVLPVSPVYANVAITGNVNTLVSVGYVEAALIAAVSGYFSLPFGTQAELSQISAAAANAGQGLLTALTVTLTASGSSTPVSGLGALPYQRVLLNSVSVIL